MEQPGAYLSPLNTRGLLHTLGLLIPGSGPSQEQQPATSRRRKAIECWRCPECDAVHDWESDAEECCAPVIGLHDQEAAIQCPVCAQEYASHRDAVDCCLWKDMDAPTRWTLADAVEAGATWAEALAAYMLPKVRIEPGP